jgi:tetratricopeptide (TPR) repeat protein
VIAFSGSASFDVVDILSNLVNQSLLFTKQIDGRMRYFPFVSVTGFLSRTWMLTSGDEERRALLDRWADYYLSFAASHNELIASPEGQRSLSLIGLELENLLAIQSVFSDLGEGRTAALAILNLARTMAVRGPAPHRIPRLEAALEALPEDELELVSRLRTYLSEAYWAKGLWNEAELEAGRAVAAAQAVDDSWLLAVALCQRGKMLANRGHYRRAVKSLCKALEIFEKGEFRAKQAETHANIGAALERTGELESSLEHFSVALELGSKLDSKVILEQVYGRRGLAYWHHGYPEQALADIDRAESANKEVQDEAWQGAHRTNKALVLADMDRFDEALALFQEAGQCHERLGYDHWLAVNYGGWGRTLLMRREDGDVETAIDLIRRAEDLARKVYYPENIALHMGDLARLYQALGRWQDTRRCAREAVALQRRMGSDREHRHFCNLVCLALACFHLQIRDECWESAFRACGVAKRIEISGQHPIRRVREGLSDLEWLDRQLAMQKEDSCQRYRPPARVGGVELAADRVFEISHKVASMFALPGFDYPWLDIEDYLESQGEDALRLFGYGSLINEESAARTVSVDADGRLATIAFGVLRLLDYDLPPEFRHRSHYSVPIGEPRARGLFNVRFTGSVTDCANGVMFSVRKEDIQALREREVGYDLRPVVCVPWDDVGSSPFLAYVLGASGRRWNNHQLSNSSLKPNRKYFDVCRRGAAGFSVDFLDFFLKSSFLADGETTTAEWEALGGSSDHD